MWLISNFNFLQALCLAWFLLIISRYKRLLNFGRVSPRLTILLLKFVFHVLSGLDEWNLKILIFHITIQISLCDFKFIQLLLAEVIFGYRWKLKLLSIELYGWHLNIWEFRFFHSMLYKRVLELKHFIELRLLQVLTKFINIMLKR